MYYITESGHPVKRNTPIENGTRITKEEYKKICIETNEFIKETFEDIIHQEE